MYVGRICILILETSPSNTQGRIIKALKEETDIR